MQRRLALPLLAVALSIALAGCVHPVGMLDMEPVDDADLAERASHETTGAERYPSIDQQRTAREVIENGSLTIPAVRQPLRSGLPYAYEGAYYNLSYEVVGQEPGESSLIRVDYNASDPQGTAVAFADLPAVDRERLRPVLAHEPPHLRDGPEADLPLVYLEADAADSFLLDHGQERLVVDFRGETYVVSVERVRQDAVDVYRYQSTRIAGSAEAYAGDLRSTYAFTLSDLDGGETDVVETAIEEGYYPGGTDDESFDSLVDRFRQHPRVEGEGGHGSWLVSYDGQLYWAEMDYAQFVADEGSSTTPDVTPH